MTIVSQLRSNIRVFPIHVDGRGLPGLITTRRLSSLLRPINVRLIRGVIRRGSQAHLPPTKGGRVLDRLRNGRVHLILPLQASATSRITIRHRLRFVLIGTNQNVARCTIAFPVNDRRVHRTPLLRLKSVPRASLFNQATSHLMVFIRSQSGVVRRRLPLLMRRPTMRIRLRFRRFVGKDISALILRRQVPLGRNFVVLCRHVRVELILLQGGRVRGTTAFFTPTLCRFQVN